MSYTSERVSNIAKIKMLKQKLIIQNKKKANFKESKQTLRRVKIFPIMAVPLQARRGPQGSRKLRFPDYMTIAQDSGKIVSLTHQPPLPPGNTPGTNFC